MKKFWENSEKIKYLSKLIPAAAVIAAAGISGTYQKDVSATEETVEIQQESEIVQQETLLSMIDLTNLSEEKESKQNKNTQNKQDEEKESKDEKTSKKLKKSTIKKTKHTPVSNEKKPTKPTTGTTYTPTIDLPKEGYKDGVYQGSGTGFGGIITAQVTIKNNKINAIHIVNAAGETPSYFASAKAVISTILSNQNPNVDAVSGATYSSNGIIQAVQNALAQADATGEGQTTPPAVTTAPTPTPIARPTKAPEKKPSPTPTPPENYKEEELEIVEYYKDGTYTGKAYGYQSLIKITLDIKNEIIESIKVEHGDTPMFFEKAWAVLETQFLKANVPNVKNNIDGIDTVSGATYSSEGIIDAVEIALGKAYTVEYRPKLTGQPTPTPEITVTPEATITPMPEITEIPENPVPEMTVTPTPENTEIPTPTPGITETPLPEVTVTPAPEATVTPIPENTETPLPEVTVTPTPEITEAPSSFKYKDGTYTGKSYGYNGILTVTVTISEDQIQNVEVQHKDTPEYFDHAWGILKPQIIGKQDIQGIDTVSGATYSSEGILDAIQAALKKAGKIS